jgi:hypothetical protein
MIVTCWMKNRRVKKATSMKIQDAKRSTVRNLGDSVIRFLNEVAKSWPPAP